MTPKANPQTKSCSHHPGYNGATSKQPTFVLNQHTYSAYNEGNPDGAKDGLPKWFLYVIQMSSPSGELIPNALVTRSLNHSTVKSVLTHWICALSDKWAFYLPTTVTVKEPGFIGAAAAF